MRPHIIPRIILKQFRIGSDDGSPVLVMDKSTKVIRERGVNHSVSWARLTTLEVGLQVRSKKNWLPRMNRP